MYTSAFRTTTSFYPHTNRNMILPSDDPLYGIIMLHFTMTSAADYTFCFHYYVSPLGICIK